VVFTYQGDGDLAAIGTAEAVHVAARGEKITTIFVNNAIYGMTAGQMAPTTLIGQKTTTTPAGRSAERAGYPIRVCEMISTLSGAAYVARVSVSSPKNVIQAKKAIRKAFETQIKCLGYSLVEVLSQCPTNWHMTPAEATRWVDEVMAKYYPLGEYKVPRE
jgi:2-oxoglutarate ferredoxin oxidoreductase subunit beta